MIRLLALQPRIYVKRSHIKIAEIYIFLPQHFLNLRPLPHMQGSLRPTFGAVRVTGFLGGQQLVSVQPDSNSSLANALFLSFILIL